MVWFCVFYSPWDLYRKESRLSWCRIHLPMWELHFSLLLWIHICYESNPQKYHPACVLSHFIHFQLFATLWTVAHQAPLSMGFSRQEYLSRWPCPPSGNFPDSGIEPACLTSPAPSGRFFTTGKPEYCSTELSYRQVYYLPHRRNCHKGPILFVFLVAAHRIFLCVFKNGSIVDLKCLRCIE